MDYELLVFYFISGYLCYPIVDWLSSQIVKFILKWWNS